MDVQPTPLINPGKFESPLSPKQFSFEISGDDQGKRLDLFLAGAGLDLSRSQAKRWIEEERILLNGKGTKPSVHLHKGDRVSGSLPAPVPLALTPEPLPLSILYEDPSIIVIDKPAGMVVHPAPGNLSGTLVNALMNHCRDLTGINGTLRPGIVHRLDKGTSGVMVIAKDDGSYHRLAMQFKNRSIGKVYLAIACGRFPGEEGLIDLAIGRHPTERKRMSTHSRRGRPAVTSWKVLEHWEGASFLELHPETGRTHQLRVHLAAMGHPILGDPLYGRRTASQDPVLKACLKGLHRQALHARRLGFTHPRTGERVEFVSPLPRDMEEALELLRAQKKQDSVKTRTRAAG